MAFEEVFAVARRQPNSYVLERILAAPVGQVRFRFVADRLPLSTSDWAVAGRSITLSVLVDFQDGRGYQAGLGPDTYATGTFGKDRSTLPPTDVMPMVELGPFRAANGQVLAFQKVQITATINGGAIRFGGEAEFL